MHNSNILKSLGKLVGFSILPFAVVVYSVYLLKKNHNDYYERFSSPQQKAFILGSSRAASIDPQVLDSILAPSFPHLKFFNYAFTWAHTPYGPVYLTSIKKKLDPKTKNSLFILTVEPSAVMVDKFKDDDVQNYIENDKFISTLSNVTANPNIEYLLESYDLSITHELNAVIRPSKNVMATTKILENGKSDIHLIKDFSPEMRAKTNADKMREFDVRIAGLKKSENRLKYLDETIKYLQKYGKVVLVRIPVSSVAYKIENKYYGDFDSKISIVAKQNMVNYINYNKVKHNFYWTDEVHLNHSSMNDFSKILGFTIKDLSQK